jgi:hypothetical protein
MMQVRVCAMNDRELQQKYAPEINAAPVTSLGQSLKLQTQKIEVT